MKWNWTQGVDQILKKIVGLKITKDIKTKFT